VDDLLNVEAFAHASERTLARDLGPRPRLVTGAHLLQRVEVRRHGRGETHGSILARARKPASLDVRPAAVQERRECLRFLHAL
jgi:hypothetical protein